MGKPKISIIVPIYNTKDCLRNCVSTLLSQSYPHFELLLIDDGSTDGSAAICDEFKAKDNRVKVVHKANGGVSSARNCGLDLAQGDFVCFVDSDDWVEKDYLHDLVRFMDGNVDGMKQWLSQHVPNYQDDPNFQQFRDSNPDASEADILSSYGSLAWLQTNRPDYPDVVKQTMDELKREIAENRDAILGK